MESSTSKSNLAASRPSVAGSKSSLKASSANLAEQKKKSFSKGNLAGSRNNLAGSKSNLKAPSNIGSKSNVNGENNARAIIYENTYRTKPEKKFPTLAAKNICQRALEKHLTKQKYDFERVPELTKAIANDILAEAKGNLYSCSLASRSIQDCCGCECR